MHGLVCWFDVDFAGDDLVVTLSTGPHSEGTHWYQSRFMMKEPIAVNAGQVVEGHLLMDAHDKYSYNCTIEASIKDTPVKQTAKVNMQDQHYAYMNPTAGPVLDPDFSISPYASPWVNGGEAPTNHTFVPPYTSAPASSAGGGGSTGDMA